MKHRKEIIAAYKSRKVRGCVYTITNTLSGKYILDYDPNLEGLQSRFQFFVMMGQAVHPKLKKNWQALKDQPFTLEVVEELEKKENQSASDFATELKTLEQLVRADSDLSLSY